MNLAIMPQQIEAGIPNMFPMSAEVEMYEPLDPMKYAFFAAIQTSFARALHTSRKMVISQHPALRNSQMKLVNQWRLASRSNWQSMT